MNARLNTRYTLAKQIILSSAILVASTVSANANGLPDFASLVASEGKAVVNIAVTSGLQPASLDQVPDLDSIPEQYRRFFQKPDPKQRSAPRQNSGVGSGFIVSEDGYILTNAHVVDDAANITVRMRNRKEFNAELVGLDQLTDVALLKVNATDLPVVRIAEEEQVSVGEWVLAIGSPFGFDQSASQGIVSAVSRQLPSADYVPFIQTDAAVNPGNSGGPLFNTDGEVIGINSQIFSSTGGYQGLSFAIPIGLAMNVAEQLKESGQASRGFLGVVVQNVSPTLAESFGLDRVTGALVASVAGDSPAEIAGLEAGDIILKFNGRVVNRSGELPSLVGTVRSGVQTTVTVFREGKTSVLDLIIGKPATSPVAVVPNDTVFGMKLASVEQGEAGDNATINGAQITELQPNSLAARSGLLLNDVIVQINSVDIDSPETLFNVVDTLPIGKPLPVLVKRENSALYITMTIQATLE